MVISQFSPSTQVFILRIWYEDMGEGQFEWRASVKHSRDGEVRYFRDWQTLSTYLQEQLRYPPVQDEGAEHK